MNVVAAWAVFVLIWCAVATVVAVGLAALAGGYDRQRTAMWARHAGRDES